MDIPIIGRTDEIAILQQLLQSKEPELLAIYGRRRVGKTYLIKTYYKQHLAFSCSGQYLGKTTEQLINFAEQLKLFFPNEKFILPPTNWQKAFQQLRECINGISHKKKKVIFFDEVPWLDSHKSGFLSSFTYFWNMYASQRSDLVVVICGSAASWVIEKVINNKGGLHNRVTQRIRLLPFTLQETEHYLTHKNIELDRYQLLQLYMVMGGIPMYLNSIERGKSAAQNIDKICFSKDGVLANEFNNLYAALFNTPEKHVKVIEALARKNKGLTRSELLKVGKLFTGGGTTTVLNELIESGFIDKIYPFEKIEKNALYRLTDEFSLFYFRFMKNTKPGKEPQWITIINSTVHGSWGGYAFENICLKHTPELKKALQIAGMQSSAYSWQHSGNTAVNGAQIDLLIDRADQCINICEIKFSSTEFIITKAYTEQLRKKLAVFTATTKTRKTLFLTMISTYGITKNVYSTGLVHQSFTMDYLFNG